VRDRSVNQKSKLLLLFLNHLVQRASERISIGMAALRILMCVLAFSRCQGLNFPKGIARQHGQRLKLSMGLFDGIKNPLESLSDPFESAGPLGKGMTVCQIQVSLNTPNRKGFSILGQINDKVERTNTDSAAGLASLVSEVCLALLRKSDDWVAACSESTSFQGSSAPGKAESLFNKMVTKELSKFEKEYYPAPGSEPAGAATLVVVSILFAIRGDRTSFGNVGGDAQKVREALTMVAADAALERGELLVAGEILWTPGEPEEVLTSRDMILDYPELMDL